jgi:hypothetical protein
VVCLLSEFAMAPRSFRSVGRYCIVAPGEVGHNSPEDRAALARGCPVRDARSVTHGEAKLTLSDLTVGCD